jgi:hypothetical protein
MGFKYERNTYNLKFAPEHALNGLTVKVRSVPLGQFSKLTSMAMHAESAMKTGIPDAEALQAVDGMFEAFAGCLVSWDLEDEEGRPIPATLEGLQDLDFEFVMMLVQEWMTAIAGVSEDLGKGSASGATFPEVPMPMAVL